MAQEGWFPLLCVGLRSQWEDVHLQDLQDSYGQEWVSTGLRSYHWVLFLPAVGLDFYLPQTPNNFSLVSSPLFTDFQSEVVPGVHMLHCVFCQYRDLSDCRCADQENSTSLCVSARFLQVSKAPSLTWLTWHCIVIAKDLALTYHVNFNTSRAYAVFSYLGRTGKSPIPTCVFKRYTIKPGLICFWW